MARGRRSKWSNGERNRLEVPFAPFPCEMIESVAFRSLSGSAVKILFQLTTVWSRNGGLTHNVNGKLVATYEQCQRFWGMDSHTVAAALRQLKALGFVEVSQAGCAGNADERQPNQFRLTFLPAEGVPGIGSHEWKRIAPEDAERIAKEAQNTLGGGSSRVRRRDGSHANDVTDVTDKFKIPLGGCDGFQGEKSPSKGVTRDGCVTDIPRGKIPRIYISRPVGLTQHTTNGSIADAPGPDASAAARAPAMTPAPTPGGPARLGPPQCEACGAEIQSRRIDARFCSGRCRQRAHRHASNGLVTPVAAALPKLVWTNPIVRELFGEEKLARLAEVGQ